MVLIAKGKTEYHFTVKDVKDAEQKIQSWLSANSFKKTEEDGQVIYRGGDALVGNRFFEYNIDGSQVTLYAYLGSPKKPLALADGLAGAATIVPYRNALDPLLAALDGVENSNQQEPTASSKTKPQTQGTYNDFKQANSKRDNTFAEISFWVSIVMLVSSFFGIIAGAIIIIFNYYLAIQGLKSEKRGKAIAAIVMSSVAIVVVIVALIIDVLNK